jgi:hypothetical protein
MQRRAGGLTWRRWLTLGCGLLALAPAAVLTSTAPALGKEVLVPHSASGEADGVSATLTWMEAPSPGSPASSTELSIHQAAWSPGTSLRLPVRSPACSPCGVATAPHEPPLEVADLEGNGRAVIVVRLTTGGAHCCSVVQFHVSLPDMPGTYTTLERNYGDPGVRIGPRAPDGHDELLSADDRFAYAFASFAFSGLPIRIWELRWPTIVDVTRSFPQAIAADARKWWKAFLANRRRGLGLGFIAAWAADERLLGRRGVVARTLAHEARAHQLRSGDHITPGGRAFIANLNRFLRNAGYP